MHQWFPFVVLLGLLVYLSGILLISEASQFARAKVNNLHVRFISHHLRRRISSSKTAFDPYSYSGGHWLHRNEQRQESRRLEFSFDALLDVAVKHCEGAREVVACEKKEGGSNRVFIIELDNGAKVVAKVPMRYAGPAASMTMSEVATMRYVRSKTSIPVPKVLAWNANPDSGSVGAEYTIMEHITGVALNEVWSKVTKVQHINFIERMGGLVKQLCALEFGAFGSLYLETADKPSNTYAIDGECCIGPHCGRQFWGYNNDQTIQAAVPLGLQGPWQDMSSFFADLTHVGKEAVNQRDPPQSVARDHFQLLDVRIKALNTIGGTAAFQDSFSALLLHPDLHARNIFVDPNDPTQILGIIDWQSAAVEPAFVHAQATPDFAEELLPDRTLDADMSKDSREAQEHAQRCGQAWAVMAFVCPRLGEATMLKPTLGRYLAGVSSGNYEDATTLRSLLTDLSSEWNGLGLPGDCPYKPSQADAGLLSVELDDLKSTERLRAYLSRLLRCEPNGWVEERRWDEVLPLYREQYAEFVSACVASREAEETVEDVVKKADRLWPFDLR